jgi:plasmid stability protein
MAQALIRNIDDADMAEIRAQAARQGISVEQRLRDVVAEAARADRDAFWHLAAKMREATRGANLTVEQVLEESRREREDRDRRIIGDL